MPHYPLCQLLSQMKWQCWIVTIPPPPPSLLSIAKPIKWWLITIMYKLHPHLFFPYILMIEYTNSILATPYSLHSTNHKSSLKAALFLYRLSHMAPPIQWWCSLGEFSSLCTIEQPEGWSFFFCTDYWVPLPYQQPTHVLHTHIAPFQPVYCFYNIISSISHLFCVQPMGLHHPCILNICIVGLCPINFSTCLLLLQVVLRLLSHPYLICSVVQPMGLHHPGILNICIEGPCPINFSACLLLLQVVLRSSSPWPYIFLFCSHAPCNSSHMSLLGI